MKPVLWQCGWIQIHSFGLLAALGFLVSYALWMRRSARAGLTAARASQAALVSVLAGIVGARLYYVIQHAREFAGLPARALWALWEGGLVWYGGFAIGLLVFVGMTRGGRAAALDAAAPSLALGQAFGRVGCFLNGCCYGKLCDFFQIGSGMGGGRFPVQLTEASALFLGTLFLLFLEKRVRLKPMGLFWIYTAGAAWIRFGSEFLRGDQTFLGLGMSAPQGMALGIAGVGTGMVMRGFFGKNAAR